MAIGVTHIGDMPGLPADLGLSGCWLVRLTLDGTATSVAITLPLTAGIKTIRRCIGGAGHNIPAAGIAAATGFTVKFAAGANNDILELLIQGDGR